MKRARTKVAVALVVAGVVGMGGAAAFAGGGGGIRATLTGFEEVPALSTPGVGEFEAAVRRDEELVRYRLSFGDTETPVTQAHIHFENATNNGPIVIWLCTNLGNAPAGIVVQACPAAGGTVSGDITADDVAAGAAAQGLAAGEFDEFVRALRSGSMYVNVHTTGRPGGGIRAQLDDHQRQGHRHDDD